MIEFIKRVFRPLRDSARLAGARLFGSLVCPVCETSVIGFRRLPKAISEPLKKHGWPYAFEDAETLNVAAYSCPHCNASDRDRLFALFLSQYFDESCDEPIRVLEFAPTPALNRWFDRRGDAIERRTADLLAEGVDDVVDIEDMRAYPDRRFDLFICSHVLEHVTDDRRALSELWRILAVGGAGILMVPIILSIKAIDEDPSVVDGSERWRRFGQADHVRLYSKSGFVSRVEEAGFRVEQLGAAHFTKESFARHGVTTQSVLYVVHKDAEEISESFASTISQDRLEDSVRAACETSDGGIR